MCKLVWNTSVMWLPLGIHFVNICNPPVPVGLGGWGGGGGGGLGLTYLYGMMDILTTIYFTSVHTVPLSLDSEPLLAAHLMDRVAAKIPHKFVTVGLQLGLTLGELQVIGPHHPSLEDRHRAFIEMFDVWRRRGSPPYTWRTIIGVLRCASVGEILLSEQLTSWIIEGSGDS